MKTDDCVHPLGGRARILFTSVFGPYAQDDEYGSRKINPMELYHNQVTRVQGPFSVRMFHRSFGLMMIEANIDAPCRILDFPSLERFISEIEGRDYDIVGISSIMPNQGKVKKMCELIRRHLPNATIVVGGHIANMPGIREVIDLDHVVKGDGIRWFRKFLGQDENAPITHPLAYSGFGTRALGITLPDKPGETAAVLIPSVGCPMGCNFCATSSHFGGKGRFVNFYETGDELFSVISRLEKELLVRSFFVLDENFLLHKKRALRLLELMKEHNKSWTFYVFSSAGVLESYSMEQLVDLGISWVWMGLEGEDSQYSKLRGTKTFKLVKTLQDHGICVLGSTIIGLENHTPDNIDQVIDYAVSHDTDFHQFMLYSPVPGTPLYDQLKQEERLLPEEKIAIADVHGQYRFNYRHQHISGGKETEYLLRAFQKDFERNGSSIGRMLNTMMKGWKRYKNHPDPRVRDRFTWESRGFKDAFAGTLWAMKKWYRDVPRVYKRVAATLEGVYAEFGWKARLLGPLLGRVLYFTTRRESRRLARGWTYEPATIYQENALAKALNGGKSPGVRQSDAGRRPAVSKAELVLPGAVPCDAGLPLTVAIPQSFAAEKELSQD